MPVTAFDASKIARVSKSFAVFTHGAGVRQITTALAVGPITTSGNIAVVVTAAGVAGTPVTLSVAALNGDTAVAWAAKVRAAIIANGPISAVYGVVGASDATISLRRLAPAANDATLNISLANDSTVGVVAAPTSVATTAGAAAGAVVNFVGKVFEADGKTTVIDRKIPDANGINRADIHFATEADENYLMTDIEEIDTILAFLSGLTGQVRGTVQFFLRDPRDAAGYVRLLSEAFASSVIRDGSIKGDNTVSKNPTLKFTSEKSGAVSWTPAAATS
jgi:hypothetical protein